MTFVERDRTMIRNAFFSTLITLVGQFMLGMAVNLFVSVPLDHPGANPSEYFSGVVQSVTWALLHGPLLLVLHAGLGLLVVASGIVLIVRVIRARAPRRIIAAATIGGLGVILAGLNGGGYLNYHQDFNSMLMATFFAVAVLSYLVGLYFFTIETAGPRG